MHAQDLPITHIFVRQDARKIDETAVRGLIESIREVGIINPLRVRPARKHVEGVEADAYEVTAGAHRLRAARKLGLDAVPCIIVADDDLHAELAMIDENLMRAELSPADKAIATPRREEIYLLLHPEAEPGRRRAAGMNAALGRGDVDENFSPTFAQDTAAKTNRTERAVQLDMQRGKSISRRALERVVGTPLNTGAFLDKLKKIEGDDAQIARVERELSGLAQASQRKPIPPSDPPRNDFEVINKDHRALVRAWENAHPEARDMFLRDINAVVDEGSVMDRSAA